MSRARRLESHPEDPPLASTPAVVRDFVENSTIWYDIKNWLQMRIEDHRKLLEQVQPDNTAMIAKSQGIIANARDLLDLPAMFLMELESEQDEED